MEKPEATPKENSDLINLIYLSYLTYFIYFIINNSFISSV
ncbi:putative membrane protein [Escherichia coli BCE034_MS-14]|nr:putative membrane protein [Escherichia coli BCE034_MS-14]